MSDHVENHLKIGERRRHKRILVSPQTFIKLGEHSAGIILNISEGGLALTSAEILTADHVAPMQFQLPESREWIETNGEVAWIVKSKTEAGIRFVNLPANTRKKIRKWISQKSVRDQVGQ
jgi:c-di-GMP-binding flagellar brake protein YcgR